MKTVTVVLVLMIGSSLTMFAQFRGLGFVRGKIVDQSGAPVAGVTFTATLPNIAGSLTGVSDSHGEWKVIGLTHGQWNIMFQKSGYAVGRAKVVLETELDAFHPSQLPSKRSNERTDDT